MARLSMERWRAVRFRGRRGNSNSYVLENRDLDGPSSDAVAPCAAASWHAFERLLATWCIRLACRREFKRRGAWRVFLLPSHRSRRIRLRFSQLFKLEEGLIIILKMLGWPLRCLWQGSSTVLYWAAKSTRNSTFRSLIGGKSGFCGFTVAWLCISDGTLSSK